MLYFNNVRSEQLNLTRVLKLVETMDNVGFLPSEAVTAVACDDGVPALQVFASLFAGKTKITIGGQPRPIANIMAVLPVALDSEQFSQDISISSGNTRTGAYVLAYAFDLIDTLLPVNYTSKEEAKNQAILDNTKHAFASNFVQGEILNLACRDYECKAVKTGKDIERKFGLLRNKAIVAYCVARMVCEKGVDLDRLIPLRLSQNTAQALWNHFEAGTGGQALLDMEAGKTDSKVKMSSKKDITTMAEASHPIIKGTLKAIVVNDKVAISQLNTLLDSFELTEEQSKELDNILKTIA